MKVYGRLHAAGVEYYNPYAPPKKAKAVVIERRRYPKTWHVGAYRDGYWTDFFYFIRLPALPKLPKGGELDEFNRPVQKSLNELQKFATERDTILGVCSNGLWTLGPLVQFRRAGFVRAAYVDHILSLYPKAVPYHCPSPSCVVFIDGDAVVGVAVTVMNVELSDYLQRRSEEARQRVEERREENV